MTAFRFTPLLLSALGLSACAAGPSGEAVGRRLAVDGTEPAAPHMASLPASAGRVVAVRQTRYANGLGEEIVLGGPRTMKGENRILVEALTTARTGGSGIAGEELKLRAPDPADLAAEMERQLPGVAMRLATAPEHGMDGPIGVATGSLGRLSCVYGWRYAAPQRPMSLIEGLSDTGALPLSIRVRLCGERTVASLLADLRGLKVSHPDDAVERPASRPVDDALDAALGATLSAPAATEPTRRGAASEWHRPAARRRAAQLRAPSHLTVLRNAVARIEPMVPAVPRLPMPGDVAVLHPAAPPAPGRTAVDSLPMPR